jgi:hypothetical protein
MAHHRAMTTSSRFGFMHTKLLTWSVMMFAVRASFIAAALAAASLGAQASMVNLVADGEWHTFSVAEDISNAGATAWIDNGDANGPQGSALSFSFTVAAGQVGTLSVTDAYAQGAVYQVFSNGVSLGQTSAVPVATDFLGNANPDVAFLSNDYSHAVFTFNEGSYTVTGSLSQAMQIDNAPFNYDGGAVKLELAPAPAVPEPTSYALLLAGLGLMAMVRRRSAR